MAPTTTAKKTTAKKTSSKKTTGAGIRDIDDRALNMPIEALGCRSYGHAWVRIPLATERVAQLVELGLVEIKKVCSNQCGSTWDQLFSADTGIRVENKRKTPKDYQVPAGTGRLPAAEARKAEWAHVYPEFFS